MSKITIEREVLEQAVDALRNKYSDVIYEQSSDLAGDFELDLYNMQKALKTNSEDVSAMAQPQQEPVAWVRRHPDGALTAEFLEDATIEPVRKNSGAWVPLYTSPPAQPQQEPVAEVQVKMTGGNAGISTMIREIYDPFREPLKTGDKLYTSPPERKPLTYEEITAISKQVSEGGPKDSIDRFVRAIEAAHGIKDTP